MNELLSSPIGFGELMEFVCRWYLSFGSVGRGVAQQTTHTFVAPFARMFVLAFQFFKFGRQVTLETIFAGAHGCVFGASRHTFGFVARGKVIKAAYDYDNDQGENQIT